MVLIVAGKLPVPNKVSVTDDSQSQGMGAPLRPGAMGLRGRQAIDPNLLQLSASLYSVEQHRSVALVDLEYRGDNADEAVATFAAQLARSLPGAACSGWAWNDKVDTEGIRKLMAE
jgi:hypothetical protein